ncbi:MAG: radical SAM protein [Clostridium butyricum]
MLSILTNFGCHFGCSYCVYRENGINIPKTDYRTFGWGTLEEELKKHKGELVSISGGGDPLYNYDNNKGFYEKLFLLLERYDCRLELHTSIVDPYFNYKDFEKVVFHFTMPNQITMLDGLANEYMTLPKNVRVVYVVQEHYSKHLIDEIVSEVNSSWWITELSFRQMIGKDGEAKYYLHDYLKQGHQKDWYYIEQSDYNEYFVNDHIETEYLNIK